MKKKFTVLWIDDDPQKKRRASENLKDRLNLDVKFIDVENKNLPAELKQILSGDEPDLILMDHMLNRVNINGYERGSTAAEVIHEEWPDCPIVCVTAAPLRNIDRHQRSIYEDIFEFDNISLYDSTIISIAESFQKLKMKKNRPQSIDDFIKLLRAPEDDKERLIAVIPKELKNEELYQDESLLLTISRWVRHTLMAKPGFLYDRLWTATLLGIKEESLPKIEHIFSKAKYSGIFADKGNERWWQSKLKEILFLQFPEIDEIYPWKLGRKLPEITEADFSKCYASGEDFPETVAYTDEAAKTRKPMRLRYTVSHPGFEKFLFFEEMRMMKGAK
jgi:CheY-like chemotaxis protein